MHKLNVQILGPASFVSTLNELKNFLKFNPKIDNSNNNTNIILFHVDVLMDKKQKEYIDSNGSIKICVGKKNKFIDNCDASLELPATLKEINAIVENTVLKNNLIKILQ